MAALQIKNIPTGAGDDIKFDASYAKGDTKNVISTAALRRTSLMLGGAPASSGLRSLAFGATTDGVDLRSRLRRRRAIKLTTAYGLPRCVQPQLGSVLVVQLVRRHRLGAV